MKKAICVISILCSALFSIYYMHFGGLFGNDSALSTVGLEHPILFSIWGVLTLFALSINIIYGFIKTKYKLCCLLLIISAIGMLLTLTCDFDYDIKAQYFAHCIGSIAFSSVTGITVFLLFLLRKKYIRATVCAIVLIADLVLLLIFKETALIEIVPIFTGYALLLSLNLEKEMTEIEANRQA